MKSAIALCILYKPISVLILLTTIVYIVSCCLYTIILIYKVISCIIRWIDINHLHFSKICLPQDFQGVEVIAFDIYIFAINIPPLCTIATDRFFPINSQCFGNGLICKHDGFPFIWPGKLIAFLPIIYDLRIDFLHEHIFINGSDHVSLFIDGFCDRIGKQGRQFFIIFFC